MLWMRNRSSWALMLSSAALILTLLMTLSTVVLAIVYEPFRAIALAHWQLGTVVVLVANVLMSDFVRIRPEGVTTRRIALAWRAEAPAPLGGRFRQTPSRIPGEPDRPHEPDPGRDELTTWIYYERDDVLLAVDCLRPKATVDWLNAQLQRIEALQVPRARVVERETARNDDEGRGIE